MEPSKQSQEILSLGNKLVEELKLADSNDTLSRWMAHYLAEQMTRAASAAGEAKAELEKECFDTILKLWANRNNTPERIRPLAGLEAALALLKKIAYEFDGDWQRYFDGDDHPWKKFGMDIHDADRNIIRLLIFMQSLEVDFVNVKKWIADHNTMLSIEEQIIIAGFDKIVSKTEYYFQLQQLKDKPQEANAIILTEIEKMIAKVNNAFATLKKSLAKDPDSYEIDPDANSIQLPD